MIYHMIRVNNKWIHYKDVFNNPLLKSALSDETGTMIFNY
jgi:hypothetical protein